MLYTKRDILTSSTYYFFIGESVSDEIENIKEIIEYFDIFKEEVRKNQAICNDTQEWILLCKDELETEIENIQTSSPRKETLLLV